MKIGIITFHNAYNFGGVLQAVALQKALQKMELDTEMINCVPRGNRSAASCSRFTALKRKLYRCYCRIFGGKKKRIDLTNRFRTQFMQLSVPLLNAKDLTEYAKNYDVVVSGSDQIWNCTITSGYPFYLLNFVGDEIKKVSYASSFGLQVLPDDKKETYKRLLSRYDHLSVRENTGEKIIKGLIPDADVEVVLDPTLLLQQEEWEEMANREFIKEKKGYVLCYIMPQGKQVEKALKQKAKKLAKDLNCKVYFLGQRDYYRFNPFEKNYIDVGPAEFLSLFLNAQYVITNSFHGIAFSVNFQKNFYAVLDKKYDTSLNSRIKGLLATLELEDRIKYDDEKFSFSESENVDYEKALKRLDAERESSWAFLKTAIKGV